MCVKMNISLLVNTFNESGWPIVPSSDGALHSFSSPLPHKNGSDTPESVGIQHLRVSVLNHRATLDQFYHRDKSICGDETICHGGHPAEPPVDTISWLRRLLSSARPLPVWSHRRSDRAEY